MEDPQIYNLFDKNLNRISEGGTSTYMIDPERIDAGLLSGTQTSQVGDGKTQFLNTSVSGKSITVSPGQSIQQAVDQLTEFGGGTVYLDTGTHILTSSTNLTKNINVIGGGVGTTIIDARAASFGFRAMGTRRIIGGSQVSISENSQTVTGTGTDFTQIQPGDYLYANFSGTIHHIEQVESVESATSLTLKRAWAGEGVTVMASMDFIFFDMPANVSVSDLTILGDSGTTGISMENTYNASLKNIRAEECGTGIDFDDVLYARMDNVTATLCTTGFNINDTANSDYSSCSALGCTSHGFQYQSSAENLSNADTMTGCLAHSNEGNGFYVNPTGGVRLIACVSTQNGNDGFKVENSSAVMFIGCSAESNVGRGFYVTGASSDIYHVACSSRTHSGDHNFLSDTTGEAVFYIGCRGANTTEVNFDISGGVPTSIGNFGGPSAQEYQQFKMKNNSGGALAQGDTVVLDNVAAGDNITTTTTQGDDLVFGVVSSSSISDGAYGQIVSLGKITTLKVDGTTDIAVGDHLGTFTTAGIAMKAAAGDMAFAIALEAYTTNDSNGVIDALLIKPRKI